MRRFMTMCAVAALAACTAGGASLSPAGWQKLPGATATWVNGTSARRQTYAYSKERFNGTLQDLAQREIVNDSLRNRDLKFVKSDVFGPCPGLAAIATFAEVERCKMLSRCRPVTRSSFNTSARPTRTTTPRPCPRCSGHSAPRRLSELRTAARTVAVTRA